MLRRILVTAIIVLVFFLFGFYLGRQIQSKETKDLNQKLSDLNIVNVTGVVEKIEGKTLTVKILDPLNSPSFSIARQPIFKEIKVTVTDQTLIQKTTLPVQFDEKTGKPILNKAQFEDLKQGAQISIVLDSSLYPDFKKDFIAKEIIIASIP